MDISEEIKEKKESEKQLLEQLAIFNILAKNYLNIYLLYPNTGKAKILKLKGYVTTGLDKTSDKIYNYSDVYKQYVKERVAPAYQEYMYEAISLETIKKELSDKDTYSGTYLALVNGEEHAYQFRYDKLENSDEVIASFQNIDEIVSKEKEHQRTLQWP